MLRLAAVLAALLVTPAVGAAQSLVGVWELTHYDNNAGEGEQLQPAYSAWFDNGYYVLMWVTQDDPRPTYDEDATDAELVAAWGPLLAEFGTYEVSGSSYTRTVLVSKNPSAMGNTLTRDFSVQGNELVTTSPNGATFTYRRVR